MVERVMKERDTQYRARRAMSEQLAEAEARLALSESASGARGRVILRIFEEADAEFLRTFAAKLVAQGDVVVLAASRQGGHLLFAQPKGGKREMNTLLRGVLTGRAGKGGGTADLAQGRLENVGEMEDVLKGARERLEA